MNGIDISSSRVLALVAAIAVTIAAVSIASAHGTANSISHNDMMDEGGIPMMHMHSMMMGMMDSDMPMHQMGGMHNMMGGEMDSHEGMAGMMKCMEIMNESMSDGEITAEEMERMMQAMDQDGDGICDYCGMSIEACREMMG